MSKRLMADGTTGRVAIMEGGSRSAFDSPSTHMDRIFFHSDLDYLATVQKANIADVFMPAVDASPWTYTASDGKGTNTVIENDTGRWGTNTYVVANIIGDLNGPLLFLYQGRPVTGPIITHHWEGQVVGKTGAVFQGIQLRMVGVAVDGANIVVRETYHSFNSILPGQTLSGLTAIKTNLCSANPTATETLHIEPTVFIASKGKLDSRLRYIRESPNPKAFLIAGRTFDLGNGAVRYASSDGANSIFDDGPYDGTWQPNAPIGITY